MAQARRGRQTPTQSVVLPYDHSRGQEAIDLYNRSERTAQEWQELLCYDILATNEDDLWVHTKFGYSVGRRNGKNEIVVMRELRALFHGEKAMHTAHRTTTSHSAWERLIDRLDKLGVDYSSRKAMGTESVSLSKEDGGGKVEFRTRSTKGGLGEGYDLLVIDEAQEYQDTEESALKYVVSDSQNPQTIYCGTPPTPVSAGTVFLHYRNNVLAGGVANSGWAEWSVEHQTDPHDVEAWYETNPSLGTILTERKIADEIGTDEIDFNIQRLGLWLQYSLQSAISRTEWEELQLKELPKLCGKLFVGIKFGKDGDSVAMSIAVKTADKKVLIECIDCQPVRAGLNWIVNFLAAADWAKVAIDGANGQQLLADAMKEARLHKPILPTVKEIIVANASFEQALGKKSLCHMGQPSLAQAASNCTKRAVGTSGGFGYKALKEGIKIELLDSAILAHWLCKDTKAQKQKITY